MIRKIMIALVMLNLLGTIAAVGWAIFGLMYAGLALVDTNYEAFQSLTQEQRRGITFRSQNTLEWVVIPLLLTNVIWLIVAALKSHEETPPKY